MRRILAADVGLDPGDVTGFVIIISRRQHGSDQILMPVVRSNLPRSRAQFLMTGGLQSLLVEQMDAEQNGRWRGGQAP